LMRHVWSLDDARLISWWGTFDLLMRHVWSLDEARLISWWCTFISWWCTFDLLICKFDLSMMHVWSLDMHVWSLDEARLISWWGTLNKSCNFANVTCSLLIRPSLLKLPQSCSSAISLKNITFPNRRCAATSLMQLTLLSLALPCPTCCLSLIPTPIAARQQWMLLVKSWTKRSSRCYSQVVV